MMTGHSAVLGSTEGAEHSYLLTLPHPTRIQVIREKEDKELQKEIPPEGPDVK